MLIATGLHETMYPLGSIRESTALTATTSYPCLCIGLDSIDLERA